MSKQPPTPDKMINELSGSSAFFKGHAIKPPSPADPPASTAAHPEPPTAQTAKKEQSPDTSAYLVRPVRDGRPQRRIMIRHPFEIYADQLEGLRELSDKARRTGENSSMSKMVRDAIDRLIDEQDT